MCCRSILFQKPDDVETVNSVRIFDHYQVMAMRFSVVELLWDVDCDYDNEVIVGTILCGVFPFKFLNK